MRAAHFLYHQPVVFNDPYALQLTSPTMRRACQNRFIGWLLRRQFISESLRPITAQVVARARYAEEKLAQAVLVNTMVILFIMISYRLRIMMEEARTTSPIL